MSTSTRHNEIRRHAISARFCKKKLAAFFSVPLLAALVEACGTTGGTIRDVSFQVAAVGSVGHFEIIGDGTCGKVQLDFGDGTTPVVIPNYEFGTTPATTHTYTGWGGRKMVKAGSVENCVGMAEKVVTIGPSPTNVGYVQPRPTPCDAVPNRPPLRKGSKVHITTNPNPNAVINFGCVAGQCIYDANGIINGVAQPNYPFPGYRPLSLILRIGGTQIVQGGTDVTFLTHQAGVLEVCVNDENLGDNHGQWGLKIDVDETGAS